MGKNNIRLTIEWVKSVILSKEMDAIIIDDTYINNSTPLKCLCLKCNVPFPKSYQNLVKGQTCPDCSLKEKTIKQNALKNIEDSLGYKRPDLVKYLKNKTDGEIYTANSGKRIDLICPDCKLEKNLRIQDLNRFGFSCNQCGDGVSIPNKFMCNILTQLELDFECEASFGWSQRKRYDFYINNFGIVECQGIQHYEEMTGKKCRSLKEEQANDLLKYNLAIDNLGLEYLIVDCRESSLEWLRDNCIQILSNYFNLSNVDWELAYKKSMVSFVPVCCNLFNKQKTVKEIMNDTKLSESVIRKYLILGNKLGLCNYSPIQHNKKAILQYNMSGVLIGQYESSKQAEDITGVGRSNISANTRGKTVHAGGFIWEYAS